MVLLGSRDHERLQNVFRNSNIGVTAIDCIPYQIYLKNITSAVFEGKIYEKQTKILYKLFDRI